MSNISVIFSGLLLLIPLFISYKEHLGIGKEIVYAMLRAVIQLVLVGLVLESVFKLSNQLITIVLILIMILNAAYNTKKRAANIKNSVSLSFFAILLGTSITLTILVLVGAIKFDAQELIPVSGMIVSNAMIALGLFYRDLNNNFKNNYDEIQAKLALSATSYQASHDLIRTSVKTAITPSIDSAKTLGIVSLPGMMTGLIIGGASPLVAIKFQIVVTFMLLTASSLAVIIASKIAYKSFYNKRDQLNSF